MTKIQGVSIRVSASNGMKIEVHPDGYLGRLIDRRVVLTIDVASGYPNFSAFMLDGNYRVLPKRNVIRSITPVPATYSAARFELNIPLLNDSEEGIWYTSDRTNNLRLVDAAERGNATLWEIAVISQKSEFFLVAEEQAVPCFLDHGAVVCPSCAKGRPQIAAYIASLYEGRKETLLPAPENPSATLEEIFAPHRARVLWWNPCQGMGRLITNHGVAGVHWENVRPTGRRAYLVSGELVSYASLRTPHDSGRAKSYAREAVGVTRTKNP